MQLII